MHKSRSVQTRSNESPVKFIKPVRWTIYNLTNSQSLIYTDTDGFHAKRLKDREEIHQRPSNHVKEGIATVCLMRRL